MVAEDARTDGADEDDYDMTANSSGNTRDGRSGAHTS